MTISRRAVDAFLDRELDSHLWIKRVAAPKLRDAIYKLDPHFEFKTEPWVHQLACTYLGSCYNDFLYLLDMGAGKTKILADTLQLRIMERKVKRGLVLVPNSIVVESWMDGLAEHSDLRANFVTATNIDEKWRQLATTKADITVIDYPSLQWAIGKKVAVNKRKKVLELDWNKVDQLNDTYQFLGIDEIQYLSNTESLWFAMVDALSKGMRCRYGSTGTVFGKDPGTMWGPFFLVDRGKTLGANQGLFREAFFERQDKAWKGVDYVPLKRMMPELHRMVRHRSIEYEEGEMHDLPPTQQLQDRMTMGPEQKEHYLRALEGVINANGKVGELDMSWVRMRQITSGYLKWKDEHGAHRIVFKDNPKLNALTRRLVEMTDSKVVIAYQLTETGELIVERLREMGIDFVWYYGGTKDKPGARRRFMDDPKCRVFLMNYVAGGTGTDGLQKVARYLLVYESPTEPKQRKQLIKRLRRPGQAKRTTVVDLMLRGTIDMGIQEALAHDMDLYDLVIRGRAKGMLINI